MTSTEQGIVKILVFYEMFDRPCSFLELLRLLAISPSELLNSINTLIRRSAIYSAEGMYYLIDSKLTRDVRSDEISRHNAWKRIIRILPLFVVNPFINYVAVANSIALDTIKHGSDIDVFIIAKKKRVYLARLLLVLPLKLMRLRPNETKQNPICVSFIIDEDNIDMSPLLIPRDIYFSHWAASLITIHEKRNNHAAYNEFFRNIANLSDISNSDEHITYDYNLFLRGLIVGFFKLLLNFDVIERIAYTLQKWYLPEILKSIAKLQNGLGTIISPHIFKAHLNDQRETLRDRYEARLARLGVIL